MNLNKTVKKRSVLTMICLIAIMPASAFGAELNVITLLDGKELVGQVLNDRFDVQTPYAMLQFSRDSVISLLLDPSGQGIEGTVLRNQDRVSGFVLTRMIDFKDQSGAVLHLRKEKIRNIALSLPKHRPAGGLHQFQFRNGDLLTGRIKERKLFMATAYGSVEVLTRNVTQIEVWGDVETRVRVDLSSGKKIEGRLKDEDLHLALELGGALKVYLGNIQRIIGTSLVAQAGARLARSKNLTTGGMVFIRGGKFTMGSNQGNRDEQPAKRVFVAPFYMDRTEVTNEAYARFVAATGRRPPVHWIGGKYQAGTDQMPVVNVSFQDAADYARWIGKRLPTEEEWEKAARGEDGRRYPWGDSYDPGRANGRESGEGGPVMVGKFLEGESPFGVLDMAGNVSEWTDSWYEVRKTKVYKGGSYRDSVANLRCSARASFSPNRGTPDLGFRCALSARGK